jgi:hypothetical protein
MPPEFPSTPIRGAKLSRARTNVQKKNADLTRRSEFQTALSLHSHTHHSRESAEFIPVFIRQVPVLRRIVKRAIERYERRSGTAVDFRRVYWTPPASPIQFLFTGPVACRYGCDPGSAGSACWEAIRFVRFSAVSWHSFRRRLWPRYLTKP